MSYRAIDALRPRGARSARLPLSSVSRTATSSAGWRRRISQAVLLSAGLLLAGSALALITNGWTFNGNAWASANVNGITVTFTGTADEAYSSGTFNTTNRWTDPYGATVSGGTSLTMVFDSGSARSYVVTFSKPVDNPVLHVDRIGGFYDNNRPNSTRWELTSFNAQSGAVALERLNGNPQFVVDAAQNRFYRSSTGTFSGTGSSECLGTTNGTGCGSVRFNGTGITSLTFRVDMIGSRGDGDELELRWSFPGSSLIVRKQSVGGTGTFPFTTSGAVTPSFSLTTTAQNTPVSSTTYPITNHAAAITLSESTPPAGYVMTAGSCVDQTGTAVPATVNTTTRQIAIGAANYGTSQTITCTFTNSATATLALAKTWVNAAVNDTAALSATGGANNATLASTANTASETDTGVAVQVVPGNVITLAETLGAGNARTYTASAWSCSGGSLSGNTLTLTGAHAGQAIVCTITNSARVTDVSVVKSTAPGAAVSGQVRNFSVVVSNAGPAAADGAVVTDTPGAGLTCPVSGNPISCVASGGAACPGAGALPSLVSGGVAVPTLPAGGAVTFTVPCQVTATGF
ncbi:DUF11 domain-containing protein [Pseudoxanthomonas sp. LjRoot143]|uniref:prealbumin-like fold domain-containing protein n=1 Tax=unclassified Pseudoxanthomonas TaxID=2645906 RepID=UPI001784A1D4|nr:DUF11 domain-containing protein [Pseudoxanthomonas sp. PXM01]MBD9470582.1 DUF11 domain-containing protein [Pseudoxanthomonas sp. PXM01]